jgi:hypothetical protein
MRLKKDKVALAGGAFLIFLILVAIFAPLIVKYLGDPPNEFHQDLIDTAGGTLTPIGRFQLALHRAHHPRPDALAPRAGVCRVGQKHWGPSRLHPAHRAAA